MSHEFECSCGNPRFTGVDYDGVVIDYRLAATYVPNPIITDNPCSSVESSLVIFLVGIKDVMNS